MDRPSSSGVEHRSSVRGSRPGGSTWYYEPAGESPDNLALMRLIDQLYVERPFLGSRKIALKLGVNRKRVQRLMRSMGIEAIYPKRRTTRVARGHKIYPYLLRNMTIAFTQQEWQRTQSLLRPDDLDSALLELQSEHGDADRNSFHNESAMLSREIQGWLDPTDDPAMLGRFAGYEIVGIIGHGGMGIVLKGFESSLNRYVAIAGTPQYMSPEQAEAKTMDARSDLFGLGCVLYAMCTGHPPFRAESSFAILRLITDEEPRPIREINADIPDWLCSIIGKLMSGVLHS